MYKSDISFFSNMSFLTRKKDKEKRKFQKNLENTVVLLNMKKHILRNGQMSIVMT